MKRAISALILLVSAAFGQPRPRMADYALLLEDAPVAQKYQVRQALQSSEARTWRQRIQTAQAAILTELHRRKITVGGASQDLVNAVFIHATAEDAAQLLNLPGVVHVIRAPRLKLDLDKALNLQNVTAAWAAVGGAGSAGTGIKIGIIDSGIDQNHPGFQDASLTPPPGFPKGDSNYTNGKVIVARSYVAMDSYADPAYSTPDDTSPRDHVGHGTAIAMIAAGNSNNGPQATIQGVAPKAFLGNYKIFGSPGVNDYALYAAFLQALQDAVADGMDIVTLSLGEGSMPTWGPLDVDPSCSDNGVTAAPCDIYAQAVENVVNSGHVVVVASAGNDGHIGVRPHTLGTIHTPGTAPSAITVGAYMNSHDLFQSVHVGGTNVPSSLQSIRAIFGDGPRVVWPALPIVDTNGLGCSAFASGSLLYTVALIQRGTCTFSDKINNAQTAGAYGVIIQNTDDSVFSSWGAQNTGIPAVMIGNTDGAALKSFLSKNSGVTATFDLSFSPSNTSSKVMWPNSSLGPSIGSFTPGPYQTFVIKPELVAAGGGIYTAAQKLDPNGEVYNPTGYAGVSGTSYAVPMVAGAIALVKQKHPSWTPAQLKSAVVTTATRDVFDTDGTSARVNAMGAGSLNAGDALNVAATADPATIEFGAVATNPVSITRTLNITNVTAASATFTISSNSAAVTVSPSSLFLGPGETNSVSVKLSGALPSAGSYQGSVSITGPQSSPALQVPNHFMVSNGVPNDIFPVYDGSFIGAPNDINWAIAFRLIDSAGVPVVQSTTYRPVFSVVSGGGKIASGDSMTFRYGVAGAFVNLGPQQGPQVFNATVTGISGLTVEFDGYARRYPSIPTNGVTDAASFRSDRGLAPGSYITIKGADLSDATEVYSTSYLPVSLATVSVSFDGGGLSLPGHLHFVSPGQINVQIPWEFQGQSSVQMKVTVSGNTAYLQSNVYTVPLSTYSPGLFEYTDNGTLIAAAVDFQAAAVISQAKPLKRGDIVELYANGLGPVVNQNTVLSGEPSPLVNTTTPAKVTIGGVDCPVSFAGLVPPYVGLYQINATVPANVPTGMQQVTLTINGVTAKNSQLPVQ